MTTFVAVEEIVEPLITTTFPLPESEVLVGVGLTVLLGPTEPVGPTAPVGPTTPVVPMAEVAEPTAEVVEAMTPMSGGTEQSVAEE